jgi:Glycogen recognition site of AMP-activated protein kinase
MGAQQSSEKPERSSSRGGMLSDQQKKVNRRQSIQAISLSKGRASPSNPSANNATATAQTATIRHLDAPQLEQYLQPSSDTSGKKSGSLGRSGSKREKKDEAVQDANSQPVQPVAVPQPAGPMNVPVAKSKPDDFDQYAFDHDFRHEDYEDRRYATPAQLRPPRLPLPIADAVLPTPESPGLDPTTKDLIGVPSVGPDESLGSVVEPRLRRRSSMVSQSTHDEDEDIGDELPPVDPTHETVPTVIEWNYSGHRVYVTGTFANWERKYRMHHKYVQTFLCLDV